MIPCLECNKETNNSKFCSVTCASKYNSKRTDIKRNQPEGQCKICLQQISKKIKYCHNCKPKTKPLVLRPLEHKPINNKKNQGLLAELIVTQHLVKNYYHVFKEFSDISRIDLIAVKNNKCTTIQCKSSYSQNGIIIISFEKAGPKYRYKYSSADCDIFALVDMSTEKIAWIPSIYADNYKSLYLSVDSSKPKTKNKFADFANFGPLA